MDQDPNNINSQNTPHNNQASQGSGSVNSDNNTNAEEAAELARAKIRAIFNESSTPQSQQNASLNNNAVQQNQINREEPPQNQQSTQQTPHHNVNTQQPTSANPQTNRTNQQSHEQNQNPNQQTRNTHQAPSIHRPQQTQHTQPIPQQDKTDQQATQNNQYPNQQPNQQAPPYPQSAQQTAATMQEQHPGANPAQPTHSTQEPTASAYAQQSSPTESNQPTQPTQQTARDQQPNPQQAANQIKPSQSQDQHSLANPQQSTSQPSPQSDSYQQPSASQPQTNTPHLSQQNDVQHKTTQNPPTQQRVHSNQTQAHSQQSIQKNAPYSQSQPQTTKLQNNQPSAHNESHTQNQQPAPPQQQARPQQNTSNINQQTQDSVNSSHKVLAQQQSPASDAVSQPSQPQTHPGPQTRQSANQLTPEQALHEIGLDQPQSHEDTEVLMQGEKRAKSWFEKLPFIPHKSKTNKKEEDAVPSPWKPLFRAILIGLLVFGFFNSQIIVAQVKHFTSPTGQTDGPLLVNPTQNVKVGEKPRIIIPKINVNAPVVYDEKSFDEKRVQKALQRGVVHYGTTALPGQKGNNVIVGHSSANWWDSGEWKFAFVLLDKLEKGDTFEMHYKSKRYVYKVTDKFITNPTDVSVLKQTDKPTATLITCNPPGSAWRRLIIKADQISPDPSLAKDSSNAEVPDNLEAELPSDSPTLFDKIGDWIF